MEGAIEAPFCGPDRDAQGREALARVATRVRAQEAQAQELLLDLDLGALVRAPVPPLDGLVEARVPAAAVAVDAVHDAVLLALELPVVLRDEVLVQLLLALLTIQPLILDLLLLFFS